MHDWEKLDLPHCVYRLYSDTVLRYIGCARNPFSRISHHLAMQPWAKELTHATFAWFSGLAPARKAEAAAIAAECPEFNRLKLDPDQLGVTMLRKANAPRLKRGNGEHCPKCGAPKDRRKDPYCRECLRVYRAEYRRRVLMG